MTNTNDGTPLFPKFRVGTGRLLFGERAREGDRATLVRARLDRYQARYRDGRKLKTDAKGDRRISVQGVEYVQKRLTILG